MGIELAFPIVSNSKHDQSKYIYIIYAAARTRSQKTETRQNQENFCKWRFPNPSLMSSCPQNQDPYNVGQTRASFQKSSQREREIRIQSLVSKLPKKTTSRPETISLLQKCEVYTKGQWWMLEDPEKMSLKIAPSSCLNVPARFQQQHRATEPPAKGVD